MNSGGWDGLVVGSVFDDGISSASNKIRTHPAMSQTPRDFVSFAVSGFMQLLYGHRRSGICIMDEWPVFGCIANASCLGFALCVARRLPVWHYARNTERCAVKFLSMSAPKTTLDEYANRAR